MLLQRIAAVMAHTKGMRDFENTHFQGLAGRALLDVSALPFAL